MFYIMFSYSNTFWNKLIAFFTMSIYTHVDAFYHNEPDRMSELEYVKELYTHIYGSEPSKGVVQSYLRDRFLDSDIIVIYEIRFPVMIDVPELKDHYRASFIKEMEKYVDSEYDWLAILGFLFRRKWQNNSKWICSELIAKVFNDIHLPLLNDIYEESILSPRDISLSPYLHKVLTYKKK
jgi:hypothetical protein